MLIYFSAYPRGSAFSSRKLFPLSLSFSGAGGALGGGGEAAVASAHPALTQLQGRRALSSGRCSGRWGMCRR